MLKALPKFDKILLAIAIALVATTQASADYRVLYAFTNGNDGGYPVSSLVLDRASNLYGTTQTGGANGVGTVFRLSPDGKLTTLYSFGSANPNGGWVVHSGLLRDKAGNILGATPQMVNTGKNGCTAHCGTVFKLSPDGEEVTLHVFDHRAVNDGRGPIGRLASDDAGNLYGATQMGGSKTCQRSCGTVFKIAPDGTETILHAFVGEHDAWLPTSGLLRDKAGNLYGTSGNNVLYKIAPDGTETIFPINSGYPSGDLIIDKKGNLYGTSPDAGESCGFAGSLCGTVFRLAPDGTQTNLYVFQDLSDGAGPASGVIRDRAGNLYGTTVSGGDLVCDDEFGCGTVFKLAPDGTKTTLHNFHGGSDGIEPSAGLVADKSGNLYGTTAQGGEKCSGKTGCGTVFEITP